MYRTMRGIESALPQKLRHLYRIKRPIQRRVTYYQHRYQQLVACFQRRIASNIYGCQFHVILLRNRRDQSRGLIAQMAMGCPI